MKLLFDHHLSRKLVERFSDQFPESSHVAFHGLSDAEDGDIWAFAGREGFTIVTKDSDFNDLSALRGAPPEGDLDSNRQLHHRRSGNRPSTPRARNRALSCTRIRTCS